MSCAILEGVLPLRRPGVPFRGLRTNDKYGSGAFGASRDGGSRTHLGSDHVVQAGDTIISPLSGEIGLLGYAYADSRAFRTISIPGKPPYEWARVRLLYVSPNPSIYVGRLVCVGEEIATAQDVGMRYDGITPHVHVDLWVRDKAEPNRWRRCDPEPYFEMVAEA